MVRPIWANVFNSALATITVPLSTCTLLHWCVMPEPLLSFLSSWRHFTARRFGHVRVFPKSKAKVTSIYMMMGGLANFVFR